MPGLSHCLLTEQDSGESIKAADFDVFSKGVSLLVNALNLRSVSIQGSQLLATENYGDAIYQMDLSKVFRSPKDMSFIATKENLNALGNMGGNHPIQISEDLYSYYFASDMTVARLDRYNLPMQRIIPPVFKGTERMRDPVTLTDPKSMSSFVKGAKFVDLVIYGGQLTGFITSYGIFNLFAPDSGHDVIGEEPDYALKSLSFLKIAGSHVELELYHSNGQFWLVTTTNIGKPKKGGEKKTEIGPKVKIFEKVRKTRVMKLPKPLGCSTTVTPQLTPVN